MAVQDVGASRRAVLIRRLPGVAGAGGAAWLVDVTILWLAHDALGVATPLAAAAGFLASGVVNYTLNRRVFASTDHRRLRRYLVLFAVNLVVVSVAVPLLANALHGLAPGLPGVVLAAKVLVTAFMLPINTLVYGSWVFTVSSEELPAGGTRLGEIDPGDGR